MHGGSEVQTTWDTSPGSKKTLEHLVHLSEPGTGPQLTEPPKVTMMKVQDEKV